MTKRSFAKKTTQYLEVGEGLEPAAENEEDIENTEIAISVSCISAGLGMRKAIPSKRTHAPLDIGCYRVKKHPGAE